MKEEIKKRLWPALSIVSLVTFLNLVFFMFLEIKVSWIVTTIFVLVSVLIIPSFFLFLELIGLRRILWDFWKSFPEGIHKCISVICFCWIAILTLKALIPFIKNKYYESSKE